MEKDVELLVYINECLWQGCLWLRWLWKYFVNCSWLADVFHATDWACWLFVVVIITPIIITINYYYCYCYVHEEVLQSAMLVGWFVR